MFESEDFDLDEDFLQDIGKKEYEYYSQKTETESDPATKRRKTEPIESDLFGDISFDDEPDFTRIPPRSAEPAHEKDSNFSPNNRIIAESGAAANGDGTHHRSGRKTPTVDENTRKKIPVQSKRKSDENAEARVQDKGTGQKRSSLLMPIASDAARNSNISDTSERGRRKTLLETFKKPTFGRPESPSKFNHKASSKFSSRDALTSAPRVTLVRKFPGPAGLLPDCPELSIDHGNFLNRLEDCSMEATEDNDDSGISEYFSQDTERLFRAGAWRLMLDDLPKDFLKGHDIATIKRTARANSKVKFLAGVVQRIDHSLDNPRVALKDFTDSIEGTIHRDIPLAYPNVLEPGVVVLLRNTGLLGFQASPNFPTLQFHVMIGPKNLIAVYSEKTRLVTSPWLESILGDVDEPAIIARTKRKSPTGHREAESSGGQQKTTRNNFDMDDFVIEENDDDTFAHFDIDDIDDSQIAASFSKLPSNSEKKIEVIVEINEAGKMDDEENEEKTSEAPTAMDVVVRPKKMESVRSRLMQFRNTNDFAPNIRRVDEPCATEIKDEVSSGNNCAEVDVTKSRGFGEDLLDSDNDTEDEILSQLDVDSIVTSYNSST